MPSACAIFDVDGTLVDSTGMDDALYAAAIRDVLGDVSLRSAWSEYEHVTDAGLLRGICSDNGLALADVERQVRTRFGQLVAAELHTSGPCRATAGAVDFWNRLRADRQFEVGIATGGWGHTARLKLRAAGFAHDGVPLACSDDGHARTVIMQRCRDMLRTAVTPVYFGDGEWDLAATTALGWRFIGVGRRLEGRCTEWLPDFASVDALDAILRT